MSIAPEEVPTAKTLRASMPQFCSAYRTAEAMPRESPPPSCLSVWSEETSQQPPERGCEVVSVFVVGATS